MPPDHALDGELLAALVKMMAVSTARQISCWSL